MAKCNFFSIIALLITMSVHCRGHILKGKQIVTSKVETEQEPVIRSCGGTIEGSSGTIEYKMGEGESYGEYEHCIWTIRTNPPTTNIEIIKTESHFELNSDFLTAYSFQQGFGVKDNIEHIGNTHNEEQFVMNGSVVILTFRSSIYIRHRGFRLHFSAAGELEPTIHYGHDFNTGNFTGSLSYPGSGNYQDYELSTFVFSRNYKILDGDYNLLFHSYDLELSSKCAYDGLFVYGLARKKISRLALYCGASNELQMHSGYNAYIVVLYSDHLYGGLGFNVSWRDY